MQCSHMSRSMGPMHVSFTACEIRNVCRSSLKAHCSGEMPSSYMLWSKRRTGVFFSVSQIHLLRTVSLVGGCVRLLSELALSSGYMPWPQQDRKGAPHSRSHQRRQKLGARALGERLRPKSCRLLSCARGQRGTQFFGDYRGNAVHLLG